MALSGSYQGSFSGFTLKTEWSATQNSNDNYSDVTVKLYLICRSGYQLYIGPRTHSVYIDGSEYNITSSSISTSGGNIFLGSITKRIYHEADGSCTFTMSSLCRLEATINGVYKNSFGGGSDTVTLDKIGRMSTINDKMSGTREVGTLHTIQIDTYVPNVVHTLWYRLYGEKGKTEWFLIGENLGNTVSFTPSKDYNHLQPNNSTIYMDICCRTFKDNQKFGEDTYNNGWYMKIPFSLVPKINDVSISEAVEKVKKLNVYVQNHSKLKVKTAAEGIQGSTVKTVLVEIDNEKYFGEDVTTSEVKKSGNVSITVTVTDSRDRKTKLVKTINVEDYAMPSILNFSGHRLDNSESTVTVLRNFKMSSLSGHNATSWKVEKRVVGGSSWSIVQSGKEYTLNSYELTENISPDYEYEFKLTISDFNTSLSQSFFVYTSFALIDFHYLGRALAIGRSATLPDVFDVDMKTLFRKEVEFKSTIKRNIINATLKNGWRTATDPKSPLRFFKDLSGVVHLQGVVTGGTTSWGTVIFTLPEGFRPKILTYGRVSLDNYEIGHIRIEASGDVRRSGGTEAEWKKWACFDGINFFVE